MTTEPTPPTLAELLADGWTSAETPPPDGLLAEIVHVYTDCLDDTYTEKLVAYCDEISWRTREDIIIKGHVIAWRELRDETPKPDAFDATQLKIEETFSYYDMPLLFTCRSPEGQAYLGIRTDRGRDYVEWAYIELTDDACEEFKVHGAEIHEVRTGADRCVIETPEPDAEPPRPTAGEAAAEQPLKVALAVIAALRAEVEREKECRRVLQERMAEYDLVQLSIDEAEVDELRECIKNAIMTKGMVVKDDLRAVLAKHGAESTASKEEGE